MVQKYQNERAPIFYYGKTAKKLYSFLTESSLLLIDPVD